MACIEDDLTDSCSSGMFSSDEDADWSSDEVSLDGNSDDEDSDSYAYQGDEYVNLEEFGLERGDEYYRRPTMYAMPSIDFASGGVVDSWVDRFGSSKADFTYVADSNSDGDESQEPCIVAGFYIPVL
ncbi:hypothetical protein PInf_021081 [Phytophthora infestans]|nr:hypothetical protein PInf_021081 [Phytophthora infestans]